MRTMSGRFIYGIHFLPTAIHIGKIRVGGITVKNEDLTFVHLSHRFSNKTYYDIYLNSSKFKIEISTLKQEGI